MALNVNNVDVNSSALSQNLCQHSLANGNTAIAGELAVRQTAADGGSGLHRTFDLNPARNTREKLLLPLGDTNRFSRRACIWL